MQRRNFGEKEKADPWAGLFLGKGGADVSFSLITDSRVKL